MIDAAFFWVFAFMTIAGGILTISVRNAVHCAVWLIVSLLGTAGLFLLQKAEFLFAVQIVLYVGGIMVLFLFVIMLVNLDRAAQERQYAGQAWSAGAGIAIVGAEVALILRRGLPELPAPAISSPQIEGNVERLADVLFSTYLVPFEVASLLLLVAIVGAVMMARVKS